MRTGPGGGEEWHVQIGASGWPSWVKERDKQVLVRGAKQLLSSGPARIRDLYYLCKNDIRWPVLWDAIDAACDRAFREANGHLAYVWD